MSSSRLTAENLLESLVRITCERSQDSLELSLLGAMLDLLPSLEVVLVKVLEGDVRQVEEVVRARHGVDGHMHILRAALLDPDLVPELEAGLRDGQTVSGVWRLHPISIQRRLSRIVMFRCGECSASDNRVIEGLLGIYRNYIEVLYDSERDTLTGLLNRKTFDARITSLLGGREEAPRGGSESRGERRALAGGNHWLGIFDIDHFKRINDTHGHLYGDEVLLLLSQIMREAFRSTDLLFRYGGEEFVVVLQADRTGAVAALERFRQRVAAFPFPQVGRVTVSIGAVQISVRDIPSQVIGRADQALYYAKAHGRNRLCSYEQLVEQGELERIAVEDQIELF